MFCDKCGSRIGDSDVFCTSCGHKVIRLGDDQPSVTEPADYTPEYTTAPQQTSENENPSVTNEYDAGEAFTTQSENTYTPAYVSGENNLTTSQYKPKSNKGLIITISVCGAILIILLAVLAYILLSGNDSSEPLPETPVASDGVDNSGIIAEPEEEQVVVNEISEDRISSIISANSTYTDFGIYVRNLDNGYEFGYGDERVFPASAMCQVVILDSISRAAKENNIDLGSEYIKFVYLDDNGKHAPSSINENGMNVSVIDCIEDVAVYGDNNKSNQLIDYLGSIYGKSGFEVMDDMLYSSGHYDTDINRKVFTGSNQRLIDTTVTPNVTTAKDISDIYLNLMDESSFGSKKYMRNIFKSISTDGTPIGLKKHISEFYDISGVNAFNSQSTNDVAIITDGETEVLVAILCYTQEGKTNIEDNDKREYVQNFLIDYILETQFEK